MWIPKWIKEIYVIGKLIVDTFLKVEKLEAKLTTQNSLYTDLKYYQQVCLMQEALVQTYCPQNEQETLEALKQSLKLQLGVKP